MASDADHKVTIVFKNGGSTSFEARKYHINKLVKAIQEGSKSLYVQDNGAGGQIGVVTGEVAGINIEKL